MDTKKFNKFLNKYDIKGLIKMCNTIEEADFTLLYDKIDCTKSRFVTKKYYNDHNYVDFTENFIVCFVKHSNPRNKKSLDVLLNKFGAPPINEIKK